MSILEADFNSSFDRPDSRQSPERRSSTHFNEQKRNARNFRFLVLGIFISMCYDVLWFIMVSQDQGSDDIGDGGKEKFIRKFSLYAAYVHFLIKIVTAFVYWKTSIDFERLRDASRMRQF
jgi:hypothetical protein